MTCDDRCTCLHSEPDHDEDGICRYEVNPCAECPCGLYVALQEPPGADVDPDYEAAVADLRPTFRS